ncbi:unnamed protein product [Prunus armeniaca]
MGMGLHFNLKQRFVMLRYKMGLCCLGFKEDDGVVGPPCVRVSNFNKWPFLLFSGFFFLFPGDFGKIKGERNFVKEAKMDKFTLIYF